MRDAMKVCYKIGLGIVAGVFLTGSLFSEGLRSPFMSKIDRLRYDVYTEMLRKEKLAGERNRREAEKRALEEQLLLQEEQERQSREVLMQEKERLRQKELAIERQRRMEEDRHKQQMAQHNMVPEDQEEEGVTQMEIGFPEFDLQGIVYNKTRPIVIINNVVYTKGDRMGDAIDIVDITEFEVIFLYNGEIFTRAMPLSRAGIVVEEDVEEGNVSKEGAK